ncbi:MAG: T9SS type A sorting domain-containing protein [Bacteroidetes bacterium]|nr:T9SS type A sorting domain-containing protein [Bacteroidota bacterium]
MKLFKTSLLLVAFALFIQQANGQANASINLLTLNSGQVNQGGVVDIQVTIGNTGPTSSIGVNKVRAQISVPTAICSILGNAQQTGLPTGWIILSNTTGVITVCNGSDIIPVGVQRQVLIKVQGVTVGGPSTVSGVLSFGPGTGVCTGLGTLNGNNTADDVSQSTIQVLAVAPCTLGVTASAGTIICNGGTTTLTATPSGASGAVEYSLNGGAYQSSNTFTVNAAGSPYTVTARQVTNPSCLATASPVVVSEPAAVTAPSINVTQPTCTIATGTVTITSSTAGLTFSFDGGAFAAYPPGGYTASTGPHTLTAQNASGCTSAVTNITIDAQPPTPAAPVADAVQPTCTLATGTITVTSSTAGLTFSLDGGAYAAYPVAGYTVAAGSHTLTAQNASGCISPVTNITINAQLPTPSAPVVSIVQPTCTVATATVTVTSSTAGLTFSLDGGSYTTYPAGGYTLSAGPHSLTAQNTNGCISPVTNFTVDPQPATPSAPVVNVIHPTCTVATGTITITSPTAGLTFSLDGGAYAAYPVAGYTVSAGPHTLAAQNTSGCISTVTNITINAQPPTPAAPIIGTITQPTCAVSTGFVDLSGLPSGNWVINPGGIAGNTTTVTISGLSQGTYNFTVTNTVGCTSLPTGDIIINGVPGAPPAPVVSVVQPTCTTATGLITITSSTAGLLFSLDGGPYAAYPTGGYVVAAGSHTLTAQNTALCISPVTTITVNAQPATPAAPAASVSQQPTCTLATGTIIITSSTAGLTFSIDGGPYAAYPAGGYTVSSGLHTLTAQNVSGCISTVTSITVNVQPITPSAPGIGTLVQPTCIVLTGTAELTGLPAGNWIINPGAITGNTSTTIISNLSPGTYNYTVTNDAGCTSAPSSNIVITAVSGTPTAPVANVVQPSCTVATGIITITSVTTGLVFSLDGGTYTAYPVGGYTVSPGVHTLTAQNPSFCTSPVTSITVNAQPPTPAAPTVSVVQPTCTVATATITVTSSTAGLTFSLDGAPYSAYPAGGFTVSAGAHTLMAQNTSGCISPVRAININAQPPTPSASVVNVQQPTCAVATGIITITSPVTGLTFSLDGASYSAYPAGGYIVAAGSHTLTAQNTSGCISLVTNIVINAQPPTPAAPVVNVIQPTCTVPNGTLTITSSTAGLLFSLDGGTYTTYPAGGYIVSAGVHTISAQNTSGCISVVTSSTVNVQPASPVATVVAGSILCNGGTTTLTVSASGGTPPFEYSLNGGAYQTSNLFTVPAGTYTVTVRNASLCIGVAPVVIVTQPLAISVAVAAGTINCNGGTTTLTVTASGGTGTLQYSINGGAYQGSNVFTVSAGSYSITVRDANNCTRTASTVTVSQPAVLTATATATRILQCGGNAEITISASGGTLPYTGTGTFTRGPGTWNFTVTDTRGCTSVATSTIEAPGCMNLKVYPNPAKNTLNVFHSAAAAGSVMQIFTMNGSLILSQSVPENAFFTTLNISRLAAAPYVLVLHSGKERKQIIFEKLVSE